MKRSAAVDRNTYASYLQLKKLLSSQVTRTGSEAGGPRSVDPEQLAESAPVRDEPERGDRVATVRH